MGSCTPHWSNPRTQWSKVSHRKPDHSTHPTQNTENRTKQPHLTITAIYLQETSADLLITAVDIDLAQHISPTIKKCGLYIDIRRSYLAASPDALFKCECHGDVLIEIKCLFKLQAQLIKDYVETDRSSCLDEHFKLKESHQYHAQIQLQLQVTNSSLCHLVLWSPNEILITAVERNSKFIDNMLPKLEKIFELIIMPELLTRNKEHGIKPQKMIRVEDPSLLSCTCGATNTTEMVCCDRCDQWYHFACVGRKRFSLKSGPFYCKKCKTKRRKCVDST